MTDRQSPVLELRLLGPGKVKATRKFKLRGLQGVPWEVCWVRGLVRKEKEFLRIQSLEPRSGRPLQAAVPLSLGAEEQALCRGSTGTGSEVGEELAWVRNRKVLLLLLPPFPFLQPPPLSLPSDDDPVATERVGLASGFSRTTSDSGP